MVGSLPFKYLGLPIGGNHRRAVVEIGDLCG